MLKYISALLYIAFFHSVQRLFFKSTIFDLSTELDTNCDSSISSLSYAGTSKLFGHVHRQRVLRSISRS